MNAPSSAILSPRRSAEPSTTPVIEVIERINRAMNAHDADALAACFATDYCSEQPAHPSRAFRGAEVVRQHWAGIFSDIPDLRAENLRTTVDGDTAWQEFRWSGHKRDGASFAVCGMLIFGISAGQVAWGRLYIEPVEQGGAGNEAAVKHLTQ
jgi:ketosteroid isomerase-like protein